MLLLILDFAFAESQDVAAMREFQQFRDAAGAEVPACLPVFDAICGSDRWVALIASVAIYVLSTRTSIALLALRRRQRTEEEEEEAVKVVAMSAKTSAKTDPVGKASSNVVAGAAAAASTEQQIVRARKSHAERKPRRPRSKTPAPRARATAMAKGGGTKRKTAKAGAP